MNKKPLYRFIDDRSTFRVDAPQRAGVFYFPLVNEQALMSAVTPDLGGDIKLEQHAFFNLPVSYEDLTLSRASRNFWVSLDGSKAPWSVTGRSVWQRAGSDDEKSELEAGLLWHQIKRADKKLGLEARVLNFVPAGEGTYEIMWVELKNISKRSLTGKATSAIPMFGRSADNLRDHRHVTSLLHRLSIDKFGLSLCPTMTFNERGHLINRTTYYVAGVDEAGRAPIGVYPTVEAFAGVGGDLEKPLSLMNRGGAKPRTKIAAGDQGKEAVGALQFRPFRLKPGQTISYTLVLGVTKGNAAPVTPPEKTRVLALWEKTKDHWDRKVSTIRFQTGDPAFNHWIRWVQTQPILRKLFGCSFLPDFDYGRGGRGWRDLWQDCLALLLQSPEDVRDDIKHNFGGVRIDGSNATIIGRKNVNGKWMPDFIADRNNISRTWMDHGVWPVLTTILYLNQTGDWSLLTETVPYFRDALTHRARRVDEDWRKTQKAGDPAQLKTARGEVYLGTILEHMLVQTLVPFFNVGEHNIMRLEDADWNDGLDMAHERGESVAFTAMYAGNLKALAGLLEMWSERTGVTEVELVQESALLLDRAFGDSLDYNAIERKTDRLKKYFDAGVPAVKGVKKKISVTRLVDDLNVKAVWIEKWLNKNEWVAHKGHAWYNGYYDNKGRRVEGFNGSGRVKMTLAGQVYPLMAGLVTPEQARSVIRAVDAYLFDKNLGGVRLNTDFGAIQPDLGRAFAFAYGEKENGAVFSHMAVMYASALYQRGFAQEGHRVLDSLYAMATRGERSGIFPGIPEYFNNEGRGRYMYLTGSASWYVFTLLTQVFGVRGLGGDLLLAPKLEPSQWDKKGEARVSCRFAGVSLSIVFRNPKRVPYERMRIAAVETDKGPLPLKRKSDKEALIDRNVVVQAAKTNLYVVIE